MEVEWDEAKAAANRTKHGISFEAAAELFTSGLDYLEIFDETHSEDETDSSRWDPFAEVSSSSFGLSGKTI